MEQERNLGEQPIAQHMRELKLTPAKLVSAAPDQMTHKMIQRAMKGRRLSVKVMKKVLGAMNAASGKSFEMKDLFNYPAFKADRDPVSQDPVSQDSGETQDTQ
ncbi:MAG: hypothetical protein ACI8QS_001531 [Planctomycetota bacterium]|jgi:hypothetical protein